MSLNLTLDSASSDCLNENMWFTRKNRDLLIVHYYHFLHLFVFLSNVIILHFSKAEALIHIKQL